MLNFASSRLSFITIGAIVLFLHVLLWLAVIARHNIKRADSLIYLRAPITWIAPIRRKEPAVVMPSISDRAAGTRQKKWHTQKVTATIQNKVSVLHQHISNPINMGDQKSSASAHPLNYAGIRKLIHDDVRASLPTRTLETSEKLSADEKLGKEIAKAARANCTTAHSALLLMAIPLLIKDTLTDTGCKW